MELRVILPAHYIPDSATVRKITGTKEFTLYKSITIYSDHGVSSGDPPKRRKMHGEGIQYLIGENGEDTVITAIPDDLELCWIVDNEILRMWLECTSFAD